LAEAAPTAGFPAVWLRRNCPCQDCRDPVTGQRLIEITDIPNGTVATVTGQTDDSIEVTFTPDGHRSRFGRAWLARQGCALLRGVPAAPGLVLTVAETFGFVRETNPYRDPVPTLQLLHCLRDATVGGSAAGEDTVLVDGFAAAAALRAADPGSFGVATGTPVPFGYVDKGTELTALHPLITLSPRGRITCVRLNNRSMRAPRLPLGQAEAVYAAYLAWAKMTGRPEFALHLRLTPGDCLIFDNTRVLHARTAFAAPSEGETGERHLQGCYADLDGLLSTLAVLRGPGFAGLRWARAEMPDRVNPC
jgi:gamma-butyrobetaine dioxygenase